MDERVGLSADQRAVCVRGNRIAVRFAYECRDDSGNWFRSYGNENWEFDDSGLMRIRFASINPPTSQKWMLLIIKYLVEAAGVEPAQVLIARKLLISRKAKRVKKGQKRKSTVQKLYKNRVCNPWFACARLTSASSNVYPSGGRDHQQLGHHPWIVG
jgi:Protein of unknown function (DUF1348)